MRRVVPMLCIVFMSAVGAVLGGCRAASPGLAPHPAAISHIVLIKLRDPGQAPRLIADSDRLLPRIPGVVSYAAGTHLETGRPNVDAGYDVGLYIGFDTPEAYRTYADHPNHTELVSAWRPRWEWIRVYDFHDDAR